MVWRRIALDRGDTGTRVDRVLLRHVHDVPGLSRTRIQQLIDAGAVLVNDRPAPRASWRIAAGDQLAIDLPPATRRAPQPESLPLAILYEDNELILVNKPAGQVVHPAFRHAGGTLLNALLGYANGAWSPALITRLDRDTSGVVIAAKRGDVQTALQRAMTRNAVEKEYLAIVSGRPAPTRGSIDLALDRDPWDRRRVMVRDRTGQSSVTQYERLSTSPEESLSLVKCRLITGRTHQIRVHLAAQRWPIVGDAVYGVRDPRISRQALHAWRVALDHPRTRDRLVVCAPLPEDMARLVAQAHLKQS